MPNCLIHKYADAFLAGLKSGEINPNVLNSFKTSQQRRAFFEKYVGKENTQWVNAEFESKLLLKNQQAGLVTWAKKIGGLTESARGDIIKKIEKMEKALTPSEENSILEDVVEKRLGVSVTSEEASQIIEITDKIKSAEKGTKEYGQHKQELMKFMREHGVKEKIHPVSDVLSVLRTIKTGFDLSAGLRQGGAYFGTKQWRNAFVNMFKYAKSDIAIDNLEAEMYASKYADELMSVKRELGLTMLGESFTQREEEFASKLIKKIPLLKGSSRAYEGFLNDLRFRRFEDIMTNLDKAGRRISDNKEAMKDLAKVIAAASGRGSLGSAEGAARSLATVLFSPRWVASRVQLLTNPVTAKTLVGKKEAAKSLARVAGVSVALLGLAKMMGADPEDDPRSSDFGKIKIGNTRFDVTAGLGPYIVMLTRIIRGSTKSSVTGKISELNTGKFGQRTKWSLLGDFISNKVSPIGGAVRDALKGETFEGDPIVLDKMDKKTLTYFADQMITPLLYSETVEAFKESAGDNAIVMGLAAGAASMFGISTSSYQWEPSGKKWDELKDSNPELYNKNLAQARALFNKGMYDLQNRSSFIVAPETGENSQAEMIDKVRKEASEKAFKKRSR